MVKTRKEHLENDDTPNKASGGKNILGYPKHPTIMFQRGKIIETYPSRFQIPDIGGTR
jgi:hypothetical protein